MSAKRLALLLGMLALALAPLATAHFLLNLNVRIFHVDHRADGLELYVRMPMPYLVADKTGPEGADGLPAPAPYTSNRIEGERLVHHVEFDRLHADPLGLGQLMADGLAIEVDGTVSPLEVLDLRVHPLGTEPGFATLDEAVATFASPQVSPTDRVYVGDAVVDARLRLVTGRSVAAYRLSAQLDPQLPNQEQTANLVLDSGPGGVQVFRARGLLNEPITVSRSAMAAFWTFIKEGVRHILEGLDHVLFVLCLVAGATGLAGLLWRVTGFTLGHSVTLSLGFFGFVPSGDWFVPAVELTIALTILYAAYLAIRPPKTEQSGSEKGLFAITAFIGLIHGLGFSFVLQNILKVSSPNIWQSLVAFNIGIEIGQLLIVVVTAGVIALLAQWRRGAGRALRVAIAGLSGVMAAWWAWERTGLLLTA